MTNQFVLNRDHSLKMIEFCLAERRFDLLVEEREEIEFHLLSAITLTPGLKGCCHIMNYWRRWEKPDEQGEWWYLGICRCDHRILIHGRPTEWAKIGQKTSSTVGPVLVIPSLSSRPDSGASSGSETG